MQSPVHKFNLDRYLTIASTRTTIYKKNQKSQLKILGNCFSLLAFISFSSSMRVCVYSDEQCDQIGRFLKVLGNKFAYKSSPKRMLTFGPF